VPLGIHILSRGKEDGHLDSDSSAILRNIVGRLTYDTVGCLKYWDCRKFVQAAIVDWKTVVQDRVGRTCPAIIMMQQVSLKGSGFVHIAMSWDSSLSVGTGPQAARLENHGWVDSGGHSFCCYHHVEPNHEAHLMCCTLGTAACG
jgi:hypothetical protein